MLTSIAPALFTLLPTLAASPANVVLVVVDDLGYGDLGCYGGTDIPTPNIDAIAYAGVRCTNGYAVSPMCGPSRAGMLTGRYPQRFGFEFIGNERDSTHRDYYGLPSEQVTLAERLKDAGYRNSLVGKWHLGQARGRLPLDQGFHSFLGILGGAMGYLTSTGIRTINENYTTTEVSGYLTDVFTHRAMAFIRNNYQRPFFLCLSYNAVHTPYQAPENLKKPFSSLPEPRRTYAAMLAAVDAGVGKVRSTLQDLGIGQNTLIVFTSDNGGLIEDGGAASNAPLRSGKRYMYEGGIRVPYLMSWPARLPQGQTYDQPVSALDIVPTVMAAAQKPVAGSEKLDGVNLGPFFRGQLAGPPHEALFWRMGSKWAIRMGDDKLVESPSYLFEPNWPRRMFNITGDPGESEDLKAEDPERAQELLSRWKRWSATLMDPLWPGG